MHHDKRNARERKMARTWALLEATVVLVVGLVPRLAESLQMNFRLCVIRYPCSPVDAVET
jgi:hypothetical protein